MLVFITQEEERYFDIPADLLIGWGKRGFMIHLLVGWRCIRAPSRGLKGVGQIAQGMGRDIAIG